MTEKNQDTVRLLWADDDSQDALDALADRLDDANFLVERVLDYEGAVRTLEQDNRIHSVLLDIILPYARGSGSLAYDLGIMLADRAATMGVRSIVFLTVVRKSEVADKYNELVNKHGGVEFAYFDKTRLLERRMMEDMFHCLKSSKQPQWP